MRWSRTLWPQTQRISTLSCCLARSRLPHSIRSFPVCDSVERYKILLKANVVREYEAIYSKIERRCVLGTIAGLSEDPRPTEATKLPERVDQLRICLANYRLIYEVNDRKKQVTVFRIAHRRS